MTITQQEKISIPPLAKRPFITWRSTSRIVCAHKLHQKAVHLHKRVARQSIGVPQKIGTTMNGGRTNHVLTVAKKDTHHATVQRSRKNANPRKKEKDRDDASRSSTSSKSSRQASVDKMKKVFNKRRNILPLWKPKYRNWRTKVIRILISQMRQEVTFYS